MRMDFGDDNAAAFERNSACSGIIALDNTRADRWCNSVTTRPDPVKPAPFSAVSALTDGQRDCLRLVYNHMKSKDIARALGVSPHTVDMRLRTAMRTLGVTSRIEAARILVQDESGGETTPDRAQRLYQPLIYQASDVAGDADLATMGLPALEGTGAALDPIVSDLRFTGPASPVVDPLVNGPPRLANASMDFESVFDTDRVGAGSFDPGSGIYPTVSTTPLSVPWGKRNDLSFGARLGWIFMIAVSSALAFGAILGALAALKSLI